MRVARSAVVIVAAVLLPIAVGTARVDAQVCLPTFGYGNVGYSAGYSVSQVGWCGPRWGGGWCAPRFGGWGGWGGPRWGWGGWCGPRWGWGCRPWGWRGWCAQEISPYAYGCGWPAWYGTTWMPSCGSVWIGAPYGGSFFSGAVVPYPTIGYQAFVPGFVSSTTTAPAVAALAASQPVPRPDGRVAATIRTLRGRRDAAVAASVPRVSNAAARLRAARLVAVGDRHLRDAAGDPAKLRQAVDAYRRASVIAGDQPDTFVREALALVALGERGAADAALAKAAAIDGRLADVPRRPVAGPVDPVFGDRPAASPPPVAARGREILRQIAAQATPAADGPAVATVADRWAERFGAADALVARR